MKAEDIIRPAREQLGVKFKHQGRVPGLALDCAGVFVTVCNSLGLPVQDEPGYGRNPWNGLLESCIDRQPFLYEINKSDMQAGDVLLMRFTGEPQHIAIHAGETIIHAYENIGRVVEHRFADVWRARVVRVYRFKE